MTTDEYKSARTQLGFTVEEWISKLGIAMDTHKSYSSGRLEIQIPVVNHILTLRELHHLKKKLKKETQKS